MNLNYPYDKASLQALMLTADKKIDIHSLVVDFDGEVVLDPEIRFPEVEISKYKFCTEVRDENLRDDVQLTSLYDALDEIFKGRGYVAQKWIRGKADERLAA